MASSMRNAIAGLALAGLVACSPVIRNHGYVPPQSDIAQLAIGDSQEEVAALVGQPTAEGMLGERGWYYVQSRFRHFGYRAPVETDREVLAMSFTEDGRLSNIERFGLRDGRVVPLSRRVTGGPIQNIGFLQQFFGNLGNVNPTDFLGDE